MKKTKFIRKLLCAIFFVFPYKHSYAMEPLLEDPLMSKGSAASSCPCRVSDQIRRIQEISSSKPPKTIVVFGAGMTGLTAALELQKLGHTVSVIEASSRVGGRVWTHTFPSTQQYHELGAMRIPKNHDYTRYYIEKLELTLRPFISSHGAQNAWYYFRGKEPCRIREAREKLIPEFALSPHEKKIINTIPENGVNPAALFGIHIENQLSQINSKFPDKKKRNLEDENWGGLFGETLLNDHTQLIEERSLGHFLNQVLYTPAAKELIGTVTGLESMYDRALTMFLRDEIIGTGYGLEEIVGGFDLLPKGIAKRLNPGTIRYNTEVNFVKLQENGRVKYSTRETDPREWDSPPRTDLPWQEESADHVICTLPFSVMRGMQLQGLSSDKMAAIRGLNYQSATKVLLNCIDRFWERGNEDERIIGGATMSDEITRSTYYPSDHAGKIISSEPMRFKGLFTSTGQSSVQSKINDPGPGVLVGSYNWGMDARRLGALPVKERAQVVIDVLSHIHPELSQNIHPSDGFASMSWDNYRWARGGFCFLQPGDLNNFYHAAIQPEGGLHFAGEHCSLDQGWIQGAIQSSLRAVEDVVLR